MKSKYLKAIEIPHFSNEKTKVWEIENKLDNSSLGRIGWYNAWRKYVFIPKGNCIFDSKCLDDIKCFLNEENELHRQRRKDNE